MLKHATYLVTYTLNYLSLIKRHPKTIQSPRRSR